MRMMLFLFGCLIAASNPVVAEVTLFSNAKIPAAGGLAEFEMASILVDGNRIIAVGQTVQAPKNARIVDIQGQIVTPGLVLANTNLGTVEISSRADANDGFSRAAALSAGLDTQFAVNTASSTLPVARTGGVSRAFVVQWGRGASGQLRFGSQIAMIRTGQEVLAGIHLGVPLSFDDSDMGRAAVVVQLREVLRDVRRYSKRHSDFEKGLLKTRDWSRADLEALICVVEATCPLVLQLDRASDIEQALSLAKQDKIKIILVGAAEAWRVAEKIAQADVPVILNPTDNLPSNFDKIAASFDNVKVLAEAGVSIAIVGPASGHDARLVRYYAGLAVAHGLPYDKALAAITVNPARMWGETEFGQIAVGQEADLAVWSGDPLEPLTELRALYIGGVLQSPSNRQDLLRDRYVVDYQDK